jgi:hypothetical protein
MISSPISKIRIWGKAGMEAALHSAFITHHSFRYNVRMLSKHWWRLVFAVLVLVTSLAVLAWSFLPGARIVRRQKIQPTEMQLPTPGSFVVPSHRSLAWLDNSMEAARVIHSADRFVLLN